MKSACEKTALLLIDLQRDFLETSGRMPVAPGDANVVVSVANLLLKHAEKKGWNCVFIKNEFSPNDWFGNFLRRGAAIAGTSGAQIDPRVNQAADTVSFPKCRANAFRNPSLQTYLDEHNIKKLIVIGLMADACVRATVRHAVRQGYQVIVIPEAVPSDRHWKKSLGFWGMRRAGARFMTSDTVLNDPE
jgi:nicotinamidase-related amidase